MQSGRMIHGQMTVWRGSEENQVTQGVYSQEYVSALLEKLKEKDERAIACVNAFEGIETDRIAGKSLGEFLAGELYLNKAEPKQDGSFGFTFSGLAVQLMADCFADQFKSSGAINYLELLFEHAEVGEMTVTMQRVEGLTPAQKLAAAERRIAELEQTMSHMHGALLDITVPRVAIAKAAELAVEHAAMKEQSNG